MEGVLSSCHSVSCNWWWGRGWGGGGGFVGGAGGVGWEGEGVPLRKT